MSTTNSVFAIPEPIRKFFSLFPLHTYPAPENPYSKQITKPTLWIQPPRKLELDGQDYFSRDVECLKWQAYLSLRGITDFDVRWDVAEEAGVGGHLPTLQLPNGKLLSTLRIPMWADTVQNSSIDALEGYKDAEARDESRAWVSLLEGAVHSELEIANPKEHTLASVLSEGPRRALETVVHPPPAPLSGISTPFPPSGVQIPSYPVHLRYRKAIQSLSDRLGTDEWLLGSSAPTALDALLFAYLYTALQSPPAVRREVERHPNLVNWESRVGSLVTPPKQDDI
ncbi:hypothetical protein FRC00_001827 [Tulasnella sp. 408]|nr:hypothetical protein FRC00_001827 [Tulasnella sp. 408]